VDDNQPFRFAVTSSPLRQFLDTLAPQVREIVAWQAAWKLLFGEEIQIHRQSSVDSRRHLS
jgi:hypothetical protein